MIRNTVCAAFFSTVCAVGLAAQQTSTGTNPQRPTKPTTPQQIIISGCLGNAARLAMGATTAGATSSTTATTTPVTPAPGYSLSKLNYGASGTTFDTWARTHPAGSTSASSTTTPSFMPSRPADLPLSTSTGSSVDLSKYVGQNIQVTGTIGATPPVSTTTGTGVTSTTGATSSAVPPSPTISVSSVKVLSKDCGTR